MLLRSLLRTSAAKKLSQLSVTSEALRCSSAPTFAKIVSFHPTWRSFAAEAGYLDKGEVTNRVLEVVRKFEKVQPEKVGDSSHFVNDLGLDSLDTVELVMALEDEFAIEISDAEAEKIMTCGDAITYVSDSSHAK